MLEVKILGYDLALLPQKALFINAFKTLIIADLHLGKINHFRRSGIPVPVRANDQNTGMLIDLLHTTSPECTVFLGDLFHSHYNEEWQVLGQVIDHFPSCEFELVKGNHDIMSDHLYNKYKIRILEKKELGPFSLTHIPMEEIPNGQYNMAGHIHPGARLIGRGRQTLVLPCFHFGSRQAILPAFGSFTGLARVSVEKDDKVYVIADNKIIPIEN